MLVVVKDCVFALVLVPAAVFLAIEVVVVELGGTPVTVVVELDVPVVVEDVVVAVFVVVELGATVATVVVELDAPVVVTD